MTNPQKKFTTKTKKLITEYFGCKSEILNNEKVLKQIVNEACNLANLNPVKIVAHKFPIVGITLCAFLEESHLLIHTYPEWAYLLVDIHVCGSRARPEKLIPFFEEKFKTKKRKIRRLNFGN